jgi:hypothetical protein
MEQRDRELKKSPAGWMLLIVAHYSPLSIKQQLEELWINS